MSAAPVLAAEEFHFPGLWLFQWKPLFEIGGFGFTKPMLLALICAAIILIVFGIAFRSPKLVPRGLQNIAEYGYVFVRDQIARTMLGKDGDKYVPLLFSLFFIVWLFNLMSIVPLAQFPVTSHIAYPFVLAVAMYIFTLYLYIKKHGWRFIKFATVPEGTPKAIIPIVAPIEFLSTFIIRHFTHFVRLFGNMFAGHILIVMFATVGWHFLVEALSPKGFLLGVLGVVMTFAMFLLELLVQFLQAYIFSLLTAYFISTTQEH